MLLTLLLAMQVTINISYSTRMTLRHCPVIFQTRISRINTDLMFVKHQTFRITNPIDSSDIDSEQA